MLLIAIWLCLVLLFLVIIVGSINSNLKNWIKWIIVILCVIIIFLLSDIGRFLFWLVL